MYIKVICVRENGGREGERSLIHWFPSQMATTGRPGPGHSQESRAPGARDVSILRCISGKCSSARAILCLPRHVNRKLCGKWQQSAFKLVLRYGRHYCPMPTPPINFMMIPMCMDFKIFFASK